MATFYDKFARFYDRAFAGSERRYLRAWRAEALGLLPAGADLLELGSGTGANFEFYPPANLAISTEISRPMIAVARTKASRNLLVQADAQCLPFPENSFDAAFATLVFCSVPDPASAFSEVRRVLRPGGTLVLLEHVRPPGINGRVFDVLNIFTVMLIDDHFNRRTAEQAEQAGFRLFELREKAKGVVNLIAAEVVK